MPFTKKRAALRLELNRVPRILPLLPEHVADELVALREP